MRHYLRNKAKKNFAVRALIAIARAALAFKKPGNGIPAARYREIVGRRLSRAVPADHLLLETDLA
jgi:sialic acid synthase SpsE